MVTKLGVIAGSGGLPREIIAAAKQKGWGCFVVGFVGQTDPETLEAAPSMLTHLGAAGKIIDRLRAESVSDLVMAGAIRRPSLLQIKPDWVVAKFLAQVGIKALGDDGLLRAIIRSIEDRGFNVMSIPQILGELVFPKGLLSERSPDTAAEEDIRYGLEVARALGKVDVGQSVVIQQGLVLGVEAIEGTDALLQRCRDLARPVDGGVLVKIKKPQQEDRADLPTIGPRTVENAAAAGLRGIAVEAGGALLMERGKTVALSNKHKLFLIGVELPNEEKDAES